MANSVIKSKRSEYEQLIPNNQQIGCIGIIRQSGSNYVITLSIPVPMYLFASVSCSEFRPANQTAISDHSPSVVIENSFQISIATQNSDFASYLGKQGKVNMTFIYK